MKCRMLKGEDAIKEIMTDLHSAVDRNAFDLLEETIIELACPFRRDPVAG
jgi:hypothetical protein